MKKKQEPGKLYWDLIDPVWNRLSESWDGGPNTYLAEYRTVPIRIGHLYAGHWCMSEVCNRGFDQFFFNTTGILAPEVLAAYRAMGLKEWAALLAKGMAYFGKPYPRDRSKRNAKSIPYEVLAELNQPFYDWMNAEPDRWERAADAYGGRKA